MHTDPRVDAYIRKARPFAQPILTHIRSVIHGTLPDVEETIKWGMPHFMHQGILCSMAAFKEHCAFGFRNGQLVIPDAAERREAMGQFGCITRVSDLPGKRVLARYIKKAASLNEEGVKRPRPPRTPARALPVPDDLAHALGRHRKARDTFEGFSPSRRNEYVEWITGAKRPETRVRRVDQAVVWLAEGKPLNWKYMK